MNPWMKLAGTQEFSRLHERFWGQDFRSKIKPKKIDVNEETGEEEEEEEEDKIDPDDYDYILDVGINGVGSQIYVRKEFVRFFDLCKKYMDTDVKDWQPCSVVITGQSGIGESCMRYLSLTSNHCRKVKPVGIVMSCVDASAKRGQLFGTVAVGEFSL